MSRAASRSRTTRETSVEVALELDGTGATEVSTGLPFLDHMVSQLGRHGGIDLSVKAQGDLEVDTHHTVEDVAIVLGESLDEALGDKTGIRRFGWALLPLDEALVEVALDLSGRPYCVHEVDCGPDALPLGSPPLDPTMVEHFWQSFSTAGRLTLHLTRKRGRNAHHVLEACFKGVGRALRDAVRVDGGGVPSTKDLL